MLKSTHIKNVDFSSMACERTHNFKCKRMVQLKGYVISKTTDGESWFIRKFRLLPLTDYLLCTYKNNIMD